MDLYNIIKLDATMSSLKGPFSLDVAINSVSDLDRGMRGQVILQFSISSTHVQTANSKGIHFYHYKGSHTQCVHVHILK